jgi:hypothetical protein
VLLDSDVDAIAKTATATTVNKTKIANKVDLVLILFIKLTFLQL